MLKRGLMAFPLSSTSTTENEESPSPESSARRRSLFFGRRFGNASILTIGSINTILPEYSAVGADERQSPSGPGVQDSADGPPRSAAQYYASPPPSEPFDSSPLSPPGSPIAPSRLSVINPRHSTLLACTTSDLITNTPPAGVYSSFQYSFPIESNKHWATLHLSTSSKIAGNPKVLHTQPRLPRYWGCDPVTGVVELDLDNPMTIQQINVTLKGKLVTSSHDGGSVQFMSKQVTLWKRSFGNPPQHDVNMESKYDGRFTGKHSFSFSFPFPTHVDPTTKLAVLSPHDSPSPPESTTTTPMSPSSPPDSPGRMKEKKKRFSLPASFASAFGSSSRSGGSETSSPSSKPPRSEAPVTVSPLPQTFMEKDIKAAIVYDISANFVHGRFKPDSKIKSQITYIPASQPLPASQKRQQAYETGGLIPGPIADPDGWFALPTASIRGVIGIDEERKSTEINCILYLAQPLSYTRGGVIPCFLTLASDDVEALSWLSSPNVPVVRLVRCIRHFSPQEGDPYAGHIVDRLGVPSTVIIVPGEAVLNEKLYPKTVIHEVATATWWTPPKDVPQVDILRYLEGEIHLDVDLQPSCASKIFNVEYTVELISLQSAYFDLEPDVQRGSGVGKGRNPEIGISSFPVEIATLYRQDEAIPIPCTEGPRANYRHVVWEQGSENA